MARPVVPDLEKKRTVPLRLTKPQYRALGVLMEVTGETIQELLREGAMTVIAKRRQEIEKQGVTLPGEYALGEMSDDQFNEWLRNRKLPREEIKRPRFQRGAV